MGSSGSLCELLDTGCVPVASPTDISREFICNVTSYVSGFERNLEKTGAGSKADDGASLERGSWTTSSGIAYQGVRVPEYLPDCLVRFCSLPTGPYMSTRTVR